MFHPENQATGFQLHYRCLSGDCGGFSFPCDRQGCVDMDPMSERERNDYLFARAMVGRDLASPQVQATQPAPLAA